MLYLPDASTLQIAGDLRSKTGFSFLIRMKTETGHALRKFRCFFEILFLNDPQTGKHGNLTSGRHSDKRRLFGQTWVRVVEEDIIERQSCKLLLRFQSALQSSFAIDSQCVRIDGPKQGHSVTFPETMSVTSKSGADRGGKTTPHTNRTEISDSTQV